MRLTSTKFILAAFLAVAASARAVHANPPPAPSAGGEATMVKRLEEIRNRRDILTDRVNELIAILSRVRELDLDADAVATVSESIELFRVPKVGKSGPCLTVLPFFCSEAPIEVEAGPKDGVQRLRARWLDRRDTLHVTSLRFDTGRREARLEPGGRTIRGPFRVVFFNRVQAVVTYRNDETLVRFYNGPARYQVRIDQGGAVASHQLEPLEPDERLECLTTVFPLTDDSYVVYAAGEAAEPAETANDDDRFFLAHHAEWSGNLSGLRLDWQKTLFDAYDAFDRSDRSIIASDPAGEADAASIRTRKLRSLRRAIRPLHEAILRCQIDLMKLTAEEIRALHRLRSARQEERLEAGGYRSLAGELRALLPGHDQGRATHPGATSGTVTGTDAH